MLTSVFYLYNEILPTKKAHDAFIFNSCAALSTAGVNMRLLIGKGSAPDLFTYYRTASCFEITRLPIVRKNNIFNLSWNLPFFYFSQKEIERERPRWVIMSVLKQGEYHLRRKISGVRYLYEVHQLEHYKGEIVHKERFLREKKMLACSDIIVTTTHELKDILQKPPYSLTNQIEVIPLAVKARALPPPSVNAPLTLFYVGQLYKGQGIELLLKAFENVHPKIELKIVGGKPDEIAHFKKTLHSPHVEFLGFQPPAHLEALLQKATAFVAPFEATGRMPYVAHTKLYEYATWGRPIIAPCLPIVEGHLNRGVLFFEPGNSESLTSSINKLQDHTLVKQLQEEIASFANAFSWENRSLQYLQLLKNEDVCDKHNR